MPSLLVPERMIVVLSDCRRTGFPLPGHGGSCTSLLFHHDDRAGSPMPVDDGNYKTRLVNMIRLPPTDSVLLLLLSAKGFVLS